MNALRVARHSHCCPAWSLEFGDVAALNTTHHFNYLFGHKTVKAGGGGCLAVLGCSTFGTVFAVVSLVLQIVKFNKLPTIFIAPGPGTSIDCECFYFLYIFLCLSFFDCPTNLFMSSANIFQLLLLFPVSDHNA